MPQQSFHPPKNHRTGLAVLLALSFFSGLASSQQDVSDFEKRLAKITEDIKALEARIAAEAKKESTLLSQLDRIAFQKKLIRNELALRNMQLEQLSRELSSVRGRITALRERLRREQKAIETTLVTLYKFGRFDFLQFLLGAESMAAVFTESKHLSLLARSQQDIIASFLQTISDLKAAETIQEAKRAEVSTLLQEAGQKKQQLEVQEAENRALLQEIQRNKKKFEQALAEQSERAEQLQSLMQKMASQELVLPFRFVPLYEKRGKLPWPIAGKIITRFGIERRLNTSTKNNGIEIAPSKGNTTIRAIHPGKVVYADYFQGYGNLLIIDHGLNYYSLYGHCDEFTVSKGDFVKEEQPIALVGDIGSLKGISLYLEIRRKTEPLDPLKWLKRR
ncbi:MAG: peptidoglycan DD-metalloendopeptidase family protein [Acidobacteriota bacterium]